MGSDSLRLGAGLVQQTFQYPPVDVLQRLKIRNAHVFVHLMDAGVVRAEFYDLLADLGDEASIRGAAGSGQLVGKACCRSIRVRQCRAELASRREEGLASQRPS